jgi:hypothetical protein
MHLQQRDIANLPSTRHDAASNAPLADSRAH